MYLDTASSFNNQKKRQKGFLLKAEAKGYHRTIFNMNKQAMEPVVHLLLYIGLMQSSAVGCVPQQCRSLLPILMNCTDDSYFGGGDNVIALCHEEKGNLAVRFSVLEDLPRHDRIQLLKGQKLAGSLCRGDPTQSPIVQKLRPALQNTRWRRVVSMSQYDGEIRRRDEFSWRRMVFAPANSLYECKACLKLCSRVPVMNRGGEEVANLSRSVQIGVSIMKGVDGAFGRLSNQLSFQALSTILVGYHLDLATMADSNHFHDAHAGNILLSLTGKADPEVCWHDFAGTLGSSADFKVLTSRAFIDDFAGKIEEFSDIAIKRIKTMHEEFATRLHETCKICKMIGQTMLQVRSCLRKRAISAVATMLEVNAMTRSDQQKLLEKVSAGMPDNDMEQLWQQFRQGAWFVSLKPSCDSFGF